jgi:hypothetical protein
MHNDRHLLGARGYTEFVPGVDVDAAILNTKFEIRVLPETSDMLDGVDRSKSYAAAYNRAVLAALGCDPVNPMKPCTKFGGIRR